MLETTSRVPLWSIKTARDSLQKYPGQRIIAGWDNDGTLGEGPMPVQTLIEIMALQVRQWPKELPMQPPSYPNRVFFHLFEKRRRKDRKIKEESSTILSRITDSAESLKTQVDHILITGRGVEIGDLTQQEFAILSGLLRGILLNPGLDPYLWKAYAVNALKELGPVIFVDNDLKASYYVALNGDGVLSIVLRNGNPLYNPVVLKASGFRQRSNLIFADNLTHVPSIIAEQFLTTNLGAMQKS